MIPTNNGSTQPCSPISSNCVVWQGPDIPCIDLCNGDTVSDVVAALATKVCDLIDATCECNPDVSAVDLKCALPDTPPTNLDETLQAIIDYLCEVATKSVEIPNLPLPTCLQYKDELGNLVTELELVAWATLIGNSICTLIDSITTINAVILNLTQRIEVLEDCVLPCQPGGGTIDPVVSSCIIAGQEVTVQTLLLAIETEFCQLRTAVGTVSLINNAINQGNCLNASTTSLNGVQSLGDLGWTTNQSLAQTTQNQWIAICDLFQAVGNIQQNCCDDGCSNVNVLYTYSIVSAGSVPVGLNISFAASTVPTGYTDCGSVITVTDVDGSSPPPTNCNIANLSQSSSLPVYIDISGLNVLDSLVIQVQSCLSNGTSTCESTTSQIVPLTIPCPTSINVIPSTENLSVSFTNNLGTAVTYTIQVYETNNPSAILGTVTIANPGSSISEVFLGAAQGTDYTVQVSVTSGSQTVTCTPVDVTTLGVSCNTIQTTTQTVVLSATGMYLGRDTLARRFYYYNFISGSIEDQSELNCAAPILSGFTTPSSITGEVTLDADWGGGAETAIDIYWSPDGINYDGPDPGSTGSRTFITSITSGSLYIKAVTDCSGSGTGTSEEFIARYDYSTDTWTVIQSPSECTPSQLNAEQCPAGVQVAQQFLDCEGVSIGLPGSPLDSYWFFVGKRVDNSGITPITRYVYAGWRVGVSSPAIVVECCACPAFILSDTIRVFAGQEAGFTANITIPYVMGDGNPVITPYGAPPSGGTLTQLSPGGADFTYVTGNKVPNLYADTFQVSIDTEVAGSCSTAIATIQIQVVPFHAGLRYTDEDIYVFVHADPLSYTEAEALQMKNGFAQLETYWNSEFGYTGNIYWIPVDEPNYMVYPQAVLDDGASVTLTATGTWATQRNLPTSWTGGAGVNKRRALIIGLVNNIDPDYHAGIGNDFSTQVTNQFKTDYEAFNDMYTGTQNSTWAANFNVDGVQNKLYPEGLRMVLFPLTVDGSSSSDSACLLQILGAITGEIVPAQKYGVKTLTDTSQVLSTNPYSGATTGLGTPLAALYDFNDIGTGSGADSRGIFALLSQIKSSNQITDFEAGLNEEWKSVLTTMTKGSNNTYPAAVQPTDDTYLVKACPSALGGNEDEYYVKITNYGYGAIPVGTIMTLQNDGADYAGPKDPWNGAAGSGAQSALVKIIENNSAVAAEIDPTSLVSIGGPCV